MIEFLSKMGSFMQELWFKLSVPKPLPPLVDEQGIPLFQVDHIVQLSDGGPDQPDNMIALCPNCHTAKTLGKNRAAMTSRLRRIALEKHSALI